MAGFLTGGVMLEKPTREGGRSCQTNQILLAMDEVRISMTIMSAISDAKIAMYVNEAETKAIMNERLEFVKWLLIQYSDMRAFHNPSADFAKFRERA